MFFLENPIDEKCTELGFKICFIEHEQSFSTLSENLCSMFQNERVKSINLQYVRKNRLSGNLKLVHIKH